jgi:hypothetical protein
MGGGEEEAIDPPRRVGRHLKLLSRESRWGLCQRPGVYLVLERHHGGARCLADGMLWLGRLDTGWRQVMEAVDGWW